MTAPIRSMPELLAAFRARRDELQITHETIDDIGLLPDGYASKLLAPQPIKNIGPKALEGLLDALGMVLVLTPNPETPVRVTSKWVKRRRAIDKKKQVALASRVSIEQVLQITPELQAQLEKREYMKMIGKRGASKGGKRRLKTMGKRARQRAASHAARMRWSRREATA